MLQFFFLSFPGILYPQAEVELSIEDISLMFEVLSHGLAKCKICCKIVTDLERHHKMHALKKYPCPICSLSLTRADNLKRHIRMKHKLTPEQIDAKLLENSEEKWHDFLWPYYILILISLLSFSCPKSWLKWSAFLAVVLFGFSIEYIFSICGTQTIFPIDLFWCPSAS